MSSSGGHQHSQSRAIPTRTVPISDATQLPHDYCTTPGGTLFSTTPGGTRIIYDRKFLLDRRNSPMAQTPPCHLPNIPGVTSPGTMVEDSKVEINNLNNHDRKTAMAGSIWVDGSVNVHAILAMVEKLFKKNTQSTFEDQKLLCVQGCD
ncbi:eukaryotic translation initiation factor 4E-binding protein 2 isoform 1-T1 [Macrochelys suwanniensis]